MRKCNERKEFIRRTWKVTRLRLEETGVSQQDIEALWRPFQRAHEQHCTVDAGRAKRGDSRGQRQPRSDTFLERRIGGCFSGSDRRFLKVRRIIIRTIPLRCESMQSIAYLSWCPRGNCSWSLQVRKDNSKVLSQPLTNQSRKSHTREGAPEG